MKILHSKLSIKIQNGEIKPPLTGSVRSWLMIQRYHDKQEKFPFCYRAVPYSGFHVIRGTMQSFGARAKRAEYTKRYEIKIHPKFITPVLKTSLLKSCLVERGERKAQKTYRDRKERSGI